MSGMDLDFDIDRELAVIDVLLQRYKSVIHREFQEDVLKVWVVFWAMAMLARGTRKAQRLSGEDLLLACYLPVAMDIVFKEVSVYL